MRTKKRLTTMPFKKLLVNGGLVRGSHSMSEPALCKHCGAVYAKRRWSIAAVLGNGPKRDSLPVQLTICPACKQEKVGEPRGFVFLAGAFFIAHRDEIEQLIRNEAKRAALVNPLSRILKCEQPPAYELTVGTTTGRLAQRLGHALQKAFSGSVQYDFSQGKELTRVKWQRQ